MPAITVGDITALPRITSGSARTREVVSITTAPRGFEGEGFPVRRAFAGVPLERLDPFIHMDQMGEVQYAPGEPKGTPWHPHRGFETVTYMLDGVFEHADSHGGGGLIADGDTQWMTAGSGLLHIERPPEELVAAGGLFHGVQLWVNLPRDQKLTTPKYQDLRASQVGLVASADAGALIRVIAGELGGIAGPGITTTPICLVHASVAKGAHVRLPWRPEFNALVYVLAGHGTVNGAPIRDGQLAVLGTGDEVAFGADMRQDSRTTQMEVLLLGGAPIRQPLAWMGPFVMNTKTEVLQALEDYRAGRFGLIPAD
ncbi:MAG TPA: pirin family protein [Actinomycetota bacterium]|nr:pirin family protein [Actinomycetota bacterium]